MKTWALFWIIYSAGFAVFGAVCIASRNGNALIHALCAIGQIVVCCINVRRYLKLTRKALL